MSGACRRRPLRAAYCVVAPAAVGFTSALLASRMPSHVASSISQRRPPGARGPRRRRRPDRSWRSVGRGQGRRAESRPGRGPGRGERRASSSCGCTPAAEAASGRGLQPGRRARGRTSFNSGRRPRGRAPTKLQRRCRLGHACAWPSLRTRSPGRWARRALVLLGELEFEPQTSLCERHRPQRHLDEHPAARHIPRATPAALLAYRTTAGPSVASSTARVARPGSSALRRKRLTCLAISAMSRLERLRDARPRLRSARPGRGRSWRSTVAVTNTTGDLAAILGAGLDAPAQLVAIDARKARGRPPAPRSGCSLLRSARGHSSAAAGA